MVHLLYQMRLFARPHKLQAYCSQLLAQSISALTGVQNLLVAASSSSYKVYLQLPAAKAAT
jgi:site-specific recombinase XerC